MSNFMELDLEAQKLIEQLKQTFKSSIKRRDIPYFDEILAQFHNKLQSLPLARPLQTLRESPGSQNKEKLKNLKCYICEQQINLCPPGPPGPPGRIF